VFCAGEYRHAAEFLYNYTAHHRHTCIAARAGFGDLLIGAGALVTEANGIDLDGAHGAREAMVELIKIREGFYACGVAASVYCQESPSGIVTPDPVFANIGKLLLATQIYDMHRLAHEVSGGMIVAAGSKTTIRQQPAGCRGAHRALDIPYENASKWPASSRT
jgi:4-hydroxybutyryl-CoA dehydratase/vinylacetyl-CoA-Delta-isomerase